jgi:hypothetical protein
MKRSFVSLFTAFTFVVLAVTGILAFLRPFTIKIVGLHALVGFVFIALIVLHVANNFTPLKKYLGTKVTWWTGGITFVLTALFFWQPEPIRKVLGLSKNLGPALDRFEMTMDGMTYQYSPAPSYKMELKVRAGGAFDKENPPHMVIWLENASLYHIKTLYQPQDLEAGRKALKYWDFKRRGWQKAKEKAAKSGKELADELGVDAVTQPTQLSSFDPEQYILPSDPDNPMPYRLLIEIDAVGDNQPSLVYSVEIDNSEPYAFQLLELVGYPQQEEDDADGKEVWSLYYVDDRFTTALDLINSALLTIERNYESQK